VKPVADSAPAPVPSPTPSPAHPALAFLVGLIAQAWSNPAIQSFVISLCTGLVAAPKTADPSAVNCARGLVCGDGAPAPAPSIPSLLSAVDSSVQAYVTAAAAVATDQTAVAAAQASLSADTVTAASIQAAAVVAISALQAGMAA